MLACAGPHTSAGLCRAESRAETPGPLWVQVWSLSAARCVRVLLGHRDPIRSIQVVGRWLCTAGAKTVRMWSLANWKVKAVIQVADVSGSAKAVVMAPDGSLFVGGQVSGAGQADCWGRGAQQAAS